MGVYFLHAIIFLGMFSLYSLLAACRNAGVNQRKWLTDVLTQIPQRLQAGTDMSDLMPREWIKTHPEAYRQILSKCTLSDTYLGTATK